MEPLKPSLMKNELKRGLFNIGLSLQDHAKKRPHALALRIPQRTLFSRRLFYRDVCFEALEASVTQAHAYYHDHGIRAGMRCFIFLPIGQELIASLFALFRLGAIPILLDPGLKRPKLLKIIQDTKAHAVIADKKRLILGRLLLSAEGISTPKWLLAFKIDKQRTDLKQNSGTHLPLAPSTPHTSAAILFTSGSTGAPKGVVYSHGMFAKQLELLSTVYGLKGGNDFPLLAVFALFNPALGICTVLPEMNLKKPMKSSPEQLLEGIEKAGVTQSFASPILWRKITHHALEKNKCYPSLEQLFLAGCACPPGLIEQLRSVFPNAKITLPYGATEALPLTQISGECFEKAQNKNPFSGTCLGKALPGIQFQILPGYKQAHNLCISQNIGEIAVSGEVVSPEYDALPHINKTSKFYDSNGQLWHKMGDVGYVDEYGYLWFLGRQAECIFSEEVIYYPDPCEAVFLKHPLVARAALIGLGRELIKKPAMVIQLKSIHDFYRPHKLALLEKELKQWAQKYAHTASIQTLFFRSTLPVDSRHNAKIHRLSLGVFYTQNPKIRTIFS